MSNYPYNRFSTSFLKGVWKGAGAPSDFLKGAMSGASTVPTLATGGINWKKVFSTAGEVGQGIAPYISNIANTFRKPPKLPAPNTISYVSPRRVNFDDQRVETDKQIRSANLAADTNLDANTAAAVKTGNLVQAIRAKNSINAQEANTNAGLAAQTDQLNAGINFQNTAIKNGYQQENVERQIAQQREQSANLANLSDKYIAEQNEKAKGQLDLDKLSVMTQLWKNSGVYDRLVKSLKDQGVDLPGITDKMVKGGYMKVYAEGGDTKTTVLKAATDLSRYSPWGSLAETVHKENVLRPTLWNSDYTEYSPFYAAAGKTVLTGSPANGSVVVRGNKNGMFDVFVRDLKNNSEHPIDGYSGVSAEKAHSYFTNPGSTIAQRVEDIKNGTAKLGKGGSIHIKKSHEGRFTAYKKRTGKTTEEALHSKDPHVRQMANFARNAAKWHHASGGYLKVF